MIDGDWDMMLAVEVATGWLNLGVRQHVSIWNKRHQSRRSTAVAGEIAMESCEVTENQAAYPVSR